MASTIAVQSPEDLINLALVRIGWKGRIGSIYEGSVASKKALDCYSQTRDELLRSFDWGFAERNIDMTLLKSAPIGGYIPPSVWNPATNPPPPWLFEYQYMPDCLKVRSVKQQPLFIFDFDPQPYVFAVENDNGYSPPQKVILCNVPNAICTYTGQITTPTDWEPDFVEEFAAALGRRLAPSLLGLENAKLAAADEQSATAGAEREEG